MGWGWAQVFALQIGMAHFRMSVPSKMNSPALHSAKLCQCQDPPPKLAMFGHTDEVLRCIAVLGFKQPKEQLIVSDAWDRDLSCPTRGQVECDIGKRMDGVASDVRVEG